MPTGNDPFGAYNRQYVQPRAKQPVPGRPGFGPIHGGPPPAGIRHEAALDARRLLQDNKLAILFEEAVAAGVRKGNKECGGLSVDQNLLNACVRAVPFDNQGKFVITPQNPTAAQIAAAALIAQANFQPGQNPVWNPAAPPPFAAGYQLGIVQGAGNTVAEEIRTTEVLIVDELGITTFSQAAEYELVWLLGYNVVQAGAVAPPNPGMILIDARHGWPFGTAALPADLNGWGRIAPQTGPTRSGLTQVMLNVRHIGDNTNPAAYIPAPHYVEITMRGWKVKIDRQGNPITTGVGGTSCDPEEMI